MDEIKSALSSDPERGPIFALFSFGEKCEKPLRKAHPDLQEHQLEMKVMQMNSVLGENLEDLHREQDWQRSAPQALLNSVKEENLEDQRFRPLRPGNGMSTLCSIVRCNREE